MIQLAGRQYDIGISWYTAATRRQLQRENHRRPETAFYRAGHNLRLLCCKVQSLQQHLPFWALSHMLLAACKMNSTKAVAMADEH